MTGLLARRKYELLAFSFPLLANAVAAYLILTQTFFNAPAELALGITLDLTILAPAWYFFFIRKTSIPKPTTLPIFIVGLVMASILIPKEFQSPLEFIKLWLLPVVELGVFGFILYKVTSLYRQAKKTQTAQMDFLTALKKAAQEQLGKRIGALLAFELGNIIYALFIWKKPEPAPNAFTYHLKNMTTVFFGALLVILIVETALLHLFLIHWNEVVAWVVFGLSVYSGFQVVAIFKGFSRRPIRVTDQHLMIHYSVMKDAEIELDNIAEVLITKREVEEEEDALKLSGASFLDDANTVIRLKKSGTLEGTFGIQKSFKTLLLHVDEPHQFKALVDEKMKHETDSDVD